jgi:two-component system KDP operon response regulator KdpE
MRDAGERVLIIDDERPIRRFLSTVLQAHDYATFEASSGEDGLAAVTRHRPDVVILDLGLPWIDGIEVTRRLREWTTIPIIILSVRDQEADKIAALDAGADDYLTKPFGMEELRARVQAVLRRAALSPDSDPEARIRVGAVEIDLARHTVAVAGEEVHFTPTEFELLRLLASHPGRILTHEAILKQVWGLEYADETHYVRTYVNQIRKKLRENPAANVRYILNEPGLGYRFVDLDD